MGILLVRHSDAENGGELDDAARNLTEAGRENAQRVAEVLATRGITFDVLVSSPRVRAMQTAEIFARALGFTRPIRVLDALCFTASPDRAARELRALGGHVAAFGHMPTIAATSNLLGAPSSGFSPSEAVWIDNGRAVFRLRAHQLP